MAPRRSARLRGNTPVTEDQFPAVPTTTPAKLAPVVENDETRTNDTDAKTITTPKSLSSMKKAILSPNGKQSIKTPSTVGSARPPREEMHPSKAQKSTTKKADSGLILGFQPVRRDSSGNVIKETVASNTPSKVLSSPPSNLGTPSRFGFKFSSDDAQLSEEARKLMESVRDDVARIKAQMILERGEQQRKAEAGEQTREGRKIAKPKGKVGRYSDAHMAEFKKMDSIAGHPSAFRAQPGRFTPVTKSLKRKSSKALLDEPETKPSPSKSPLVGAKRVKRTEIQTTSTTRQIGNIGTPRKTAIPQPSRSTFRSSSLMTPTRSSAARFASARPVKTSMIPSLADSSASRQVVPQTPKTDFNPRLKKSLPSLGNLKSILRRRQPLFSNDPTKIAAGTHITAPNFNPDINLKDLPTANFSGIEQTPSPKKRVEFTSSTKSRRESVLATSTAIEFAPEAAAASMSDIVYPTLPETMTPDMEVIDTPTIRRVRESTSAALSSPLATIPAIPHGLSNKECKHDSEKEQAAKFSSPAFKPTFSAPSIASPFPKMPTVPHGISNEKRSREEHSKRPDIKSSAMLKTTSSPLKAKSPSASLLAVPHGIKNKKRQRADMSDDEDTENIPPAGNSADHQRNAKRLKAAP
uniref:Erythromycin esterase n=1 Tax=Talaromyces marneffei PM1 TaxID=1077442 RepID=A0A093VE26_TALMA